MSICLSHVKFTSYMEIWNKKFIYHYTLSGHDGNFRHIEFLPWGHSLIYVGTHLHPHLHFNLRSDSLHQNLQQAGKCFHHHCWMKCHHYCLNSIGIAAHLFVYLWGIYVLVLDVAQPCLFGLMWSCRSTLHGSQTTTEVNHLNYCIMLQNIVT